MKDTFKLYINNKLVDFESDPKFEFKYQQEDFSNPTIIKNSYTKSIKIEGTDNNNQIFGEIYQLDREQLYKFNNYTGAYFDPSKRTPFELYKNSELIESGYMQLIDINVKGDRVIYNITLYGGLGDFFYSLMYNEDGEKKTLSDLWYKIEDESGEILPKETELDFRINKDFVSKSWKYLKENSTGNTINNFITFAPAYNGLYDEFDSSSILVNTYASQIFNLENSKTEDGVEYTSYNGFKMAKTDRDWTEWEVRDLRSYMQRPCLKFSKVFNALCDPDNNGGYKVNLDKTFFNSSNPYYNDAYMALPLLPTLTKDAEETSKKYKLYADNITNATHYIGYKNGKLCLDSAYTLIFDGDDDLSIKKDYFLTVNMDNVPATSTFDVELDFDLNFVAESLDDSMNNDELYLSCFRKNTVWYKDYNKVMRVEKLPVYKSIIVQTYMFDYDNMEELKYYSNVLNFTSPVTYEGTTYTSTYDKWINFNDSRKKDYTYTNVFGSFKRQGNTNNYKWVSNDGKSNFYLSIKDIPRKKNMAIALRIKLVSSDSENYSHTPLIGINKQIFESVNGYTDKNLNVVFSYVPYSVKGYSEVPLYNSSSFIYKSNTPTVKSNSLVKKDALLKTEFSPADVLLDYCKLFGLNFIKDIHSKTISIINKNNFFTGKTIDISDRIDYSKDMNIKPYLFETKYYLMKSEPNETYYSKRYENEYNLIYGQKRIDTNYNFNRDTKEVYEGSVFQNTISVTDTSPYYRTFWQTGYFNQWPCWIMSNPTMELYNGVGTADMKINETVYLHTKFVNQTLTEDWNTESGYDMFPKTCFYNTEDNSKSLSDINSTLLFFNGFQKTQDAGKNEETQSTLNFWLSDDLVEMKLLNGGELCYLYTEVYRDKEGNNIAIKYNELPQFLRYKIDNNNITHSLDFGVPKEIYIPNINYGEDATLYNKFWSRYLTDRYDVNTKKVSCYVNLEGLKITQDTLRDFYYFNNCIWVINKIENYLPNSYETTKIEFVKVNDTDNYLNAQQEYEFNSISLSENEVTVDYNTTEYTIELTSGYDWTASYGTGLTCSETGGTQGVYTIEVGVKENTDGTDIVDNIFTFTNAMGETVEFNLKQIPSPRNAKLVYGYVYDKKTQKPIPNCTVQFGEQITPYAIAPESTVPPTSVAPPAPEVPEAPIIPLQTLFIGTTNSEGYYEVYVGKLFEVSEIVFVYDENGKDIYSTFIEWDSISSKYRLDFEAS